MHSARLFLVLFAEEAAKPVVAEPPVGASDQDARRAAHAALQQELTSTRQYLESVIEQLEFPKTAL